tara:strand:- start:16350 stop:17111 length:762 start_codon:yes stop_codon:yes gene_type:complete
MSEQISSNTRTALVNTYLDLVTQGSFGDFIEDMLLKIKSTREFSPVWISSSEVPIIATPEAVLSLRYHDASTEQSVIYGVPTDIYLSLLYTTRAVRVVVYTLDDTSYQLQIKKTLSVSKNNTIHLPKGESFKIETDGVACFSRLMIGLGEGTPVFNASSLEYMCMLSLDPISSRWYFIAKVISLLSTKKACHILKKLTKHAHYNVRWTALQELFNVDQEQALNILQAFQHDENQYISAKATTEWNRISKLLIH